jgi:hypothetical protein
MREGLDGLASSDPFFLRANYRVDSDYFDLAPLGGAEQPKEERA